MKETLSTSEKEVPKIKLGLQDKYEAEKKEEPHAKRLDENNIKDVEEMFASPTHVIKDGVVVVKDGEIKNYTWGKTQVVKPEYDATIEKKLKKYFDKYHTIALPNYSISNDEMAEVIGSDINEVKCSRKRIS